MKNLQRIAATLILIALSTCTASAHDGTHTFPLTIKPYDNVLIYFGNSHDGFFYPPPVEALRKHAFSILTSLQKRLGFERFALLNPIRDAGGHAITNGSESRPAQIYRGDYVISDQPDLGLIVATADCLPIVYLDPAHHAVGIAHVDWHGTVLQVAQRVIKAMKEAFGTNPQELQIIFGPAIRGCCFAVPEEEFAQLGIEIDGECARKTDDGKIFVDLPACNRQQLIACGVLPDNIATRFNVCTACDTQFFSTTREGSRAGRQFSVVAITPTK